MFHTWFSTDLAKYLLITFGNFGNWVSAVVVLFKFCDVERCLAAQHIFKNEITLNVGK